MGASLFIGDDSPAADKDAPVLRRMQLRDEQRKIQLEQDKRDIRQASKDLRKQDLTLCQPCTMPAPGYY